MTGRPHTTDPLDRIEAEAKDFHDTEWLGEHGLPAGVLYEIAGCLADDVLALIAVARAARDVSMIERTGVLPDFMPLAEALARLDGE